MVLDVWGRSPIRPNVLLRANLVPCEPANTEAKRSREVGLPEVARHEANADLLP